MLNHISMAYLLINTCTKNYWNRTTIVEIIVGGWVVSFLPAALRAAQICRYLHVVYSEADLEVFRPAGATRCTDGGEIWHGGGDRRHGGGDRRSPPPCQILPPSVQRQGCRTPKIEILTQI